MFPLSDKRRREEELHAHKVGRDYMKFGNDEQRKDELHDLKISEAIMKLHHGHAKNMIQMAKLTEESPAHEKAESLAKERAEEAKGYSTGSYGVRGYHHGGIAEAKVLTDLNARMAKHPPVPQGYESGTRMIPHTSGFPSVTMSSGFSKGVPNAKPEIGMQVMNWGFAGGVPMIPQNPQMAMAHSMPQGMMRGVPTNPEAGPSDTVPAMLTPGEAVIPKEAAQHPKYKKQIKQMINHGRQIQDQKAYGTGTGYAGYSEGVYNVPGYEEGVDGIPPNPFDMEVNPSIYQEGTVGGPIAQQPPLASKPLPPASPQEFLSRSMNTAVDKVTEKNQAEAIDNISVPYDRSTATRAEDFVPYSNPNISNKQASLLVPPSEMSSESSQPAIPESVLDNKYSMVPSNAMGADNLAPYGIGLAPYGQRYTEQTNGADYSLQAPKGKGFMGLIPNQGEVSSELSASDNGKQFPLLVPTLNAEERQSVLDGKPTDAAYDKARQYAQNRSVPFAQQGELRISPKASEQLQSQLDKVGQGLDNKGGNQHALSGALEWLGNAFTEKDDKGNVTSIMGFNKGDFAKMVTMAVGSRALGYNNTQAIRHAFKTVDAQAQQRHAQEFQAQKQTEMFANQMKLEDQREKGYVSREEERRKTSESVAGIQAKSSMDVEIAKEKARLDALLAKEKSDDLQKKRQRVNTYALSLTKEYDIQPSVASSIAKAEQQFIDTDEYPKGYNPDHLARIMRSKKEADARANAGDNVRSGSQGKDIVVTDRETNRETTYTTLNGKDGQTWVQTPKGPIPYSAFHSLHDQNRYSVDQRDNDNDPKKAEDRFATHMDRLLSEIPKNKTIPGKYFGSDTVPVDIPKGQITLAAKVFAKQHNIPLGSSQYEAATVSAVDALRKGKYEVSGDGITQAMYANLIGNTALKDRTYWGTDEQAKTPEAMGVRGEVQADIGKAILASSKDAGNRAIADKANKNQPLTEEGYTKFSYDKLKQQFDNLDPKTKAMWQERANNDKWKNAGVTPWMLYVQSGGKK